MEQLIQKPVKRNILLNPGPSTTTDTVKYAQVVPDICPREKEFGGLMKGLREDLVKIVHGDLEKYTSVLFCGSGTINIDACISSLLPEGGKVLVVDNGAYSTRAVEVCQYYGLPYIDLKFQFGSSGYFTDTTSPDCHSLRITSWNPSASSPS